MLKVKVIIVKFFDKKLEWYFIKKRLINVKSYYEIFILYCIYICKFNKVKYNIVYVVKEIFYYVWK